MIDDPLESVVEFAERAYIRIQAGEVLTQCLEVASLTPIHKLVETLVLVGPESLDIFREALAETNLRKIQLEDDMQQIIDGLKANLESYGVHLWGIRKPLSIHRLKPVRFLGMLRSQGVVEEDVQNICLQLLQDARDLIASLHTNYVLLVDVEKYLDDWMWGVCYRLVKQGREVSL